MSSVEKSLNREGWLMEVSAYLRSVVFKDWKIVPFRVTCGWPSKHASSAKGRRVGECHGARLSKDGHHEIFISPVLDNPLEVTGVLCHELAHVAAGVDAQHGKEFLRVCRQVGLDKGKPGSVMPGERLNKRLDEFLKSVPVYPHSALLTPAKTTLARPAVSIKLVCQECACSIRIAKKDFERVGAPVCGCCAISPKRMAEESKD